MSLAPVGGKLRIGGGLKAFKEVLAALPEKTGLAFVLVQHLDPQHESFLTEILASILPQTTAIFPPSHI